MYWAPCNSHNMDRGVKVGNKEITAISVGIADAIGISGGFESTTRVALQALRFSYFIVVIQHALSGARLCRRCKTVCISETVFWFSFHRPPSFFLHLRQHLFRILQ